MRTVVVDARMIDASGIGTCLKNLLPRLATRFALTALGDRALIERYLPPGTGTISPLCAPIYSLKEQWALSKNIPPCDLLWSPHFNAPLLPVRARTRAVTMHDAYHFAFADTLSLSQRLYTRFAIPRAIRQADAVITASQFSHDELCRFIPMPNERLSIIYNGVDTSFLTASSIAEERRAIKEKYTLPDHYILAVGNLKPHKNLSRLLKAFRAFISRHKEYSLVIVGRGAGLRCSDSEIFQLLEGDPLLQQHVIFTGFVPDMDLPYLYQQASLYAFPSLYEGFGLPPLEAMACRCPVIASRSASIPEICADAAHYFDAENIQEMTQAMEAVLFDPKRRADLLDKGTQRAALFSWDKTADRYAETFERTIDLDYTRGPICSSSKNDGTL